MEDGYTAKQLADLAGVSVRTLHYYEECGLLHPARDANNWRRYGADDAAALRVIRALRSCGFPMANLKKLLAEPHSCVAEAVMEALSAHRKDLLARQERLGSYLHATDALIGTWKEIDGMTDKKAFEALKQAALDRAEELHGSEARERYGDETVDATNERLRSMSRAEWDAKDELEHAIKAKLREMMMAHGSKEGGCAEGDDGAEGAGAIDGADGAGAVDAGSSIDGVGEIGEADARELAEMHARWIRLHWGDGAYSPQKHVALAQSYLLDERFVDYYDSACGDGATALLVEAIERTFA